MGYAASGVGDQKYVRQPGLDAYYELTGEGRALVFVHGAFADASIWDPQWQYFSPRYRLVRYDLRGHGRSGASELSHYSITTFADDLALLLDVLEIHSPIICGLSLGGSIAQAFAVRYPARLKALILAGTAVSIRLTWLDKLLCDVLFPWWLMSLVIRKMKVKNFIWVSFFLARATKGRYWLSQDAAISQYLKNCMLQINSSEYLKIWEAIYGFNLLPLERIICPVLVLNGEFESRSTFRHAKEILDRVQRVEAKIVPGTGHAMNIEQPETFNHFVEEFICRF